MASVCIVQEKNSTLEINKIANFSNLHNFEFTREGLCVWRAFNFEPGKFIQWNYNCSLSTERTDLVEEIPFFPTTARRIASAGESNDGKDVSSYQFPEPGCDEDFKTQADLDLLVHHVSPVPASMTESLYDKVKREWVHHFHSLSLEGESSTEPVAVDTEPLTSASQLPMGWAVHERGASVIATKDSLLGKVCGKTFVPLSLRDFQSKNSFPLFSAHEKGLGHISQK